MIVTADKQSGWQALLGQLRAAPEFAVFSGIEIVIGAHEAEFLIDTNFRVVLGAAAFAPPALLQFHLRHALELAWLRRAGCAEGPARLAAARAAAVFAAGESWPVALPWWVATMQSEVPPAATALAAVAAALGAAADLAGIRAAWNCLGTAEAIMETGGDIRLARDPKTALNGYGSSHRPRPWAVTFASSTASSSSERGYRAADLARLRVTAALLRGGRRDAVRAALDHARAALAQIYGLPDGAAVVLAASGTDTELLALAVTHLAQPARPVTTILVAPEETGSGVPMAARGLHFAVDTAFGHNVARAAPIAGFFPDTALHAVPLRDASGTIRAEPDVATEITDHVARAIAAGSRVILHVLDLSKTGLLAPGLGLLRHLRAHFGFELLDIVVDACQARLSPISVRRYLALEATVLLTGSKFFTGPPFAGAAILPARIAARFARGALPSGLAAYFGRDDFWAPCPAAAALPPVGNYGLALRWHAALAEMQAFFAVPKPARAAILAGFAAVARAEIAANPALCLLPAPEIARDDDDEPWERTRSIFGFSLALPGNPARRLAPDQARAVYHWLNADVAGALPHLCRADARIAARICHIGQPVRLPGPDGAAIGVLRVSAGARLVSGEPSHGGLPAAVRLDREFSDLRLVFAKIRILLQNFDVLRKANPLPRYR